MNFKLVKMVYPPALNWAGNKFHTAVSSRVKALFEPYRYTHTYVDPFVGSGGMLLDLDPIHALCSDASVELSIFHQWIQNGGCIDSRFYPFHFTVEDYYRKRAEFRVMQNWIKMSHRKETGWFTLPDDAIREFCTNLVWLNQTCYNSLWRVNQSGLFNVPIGRNGDGSLKEPGVKRLPFYSDNWVFQQADYSDRGVLSEDYFIYVDPPYYKNFASYTAKGFGIKDHLKLLDWVMLQTCPVVISNSHYPDIIDLYKQRGLNVEVLEVPRSIAADGKKRGSKLEILATRNM